MEKELTMQEHRKILLNELMFVTKLCDKNNIKYFLYGGTLLGAVKYKGFIPWDDDIDIALLRDDYEKLLKLLEENETDEYKVLHIYNTKDYYYPFAKLVSKKTKLVENAREIKELGVYIDIFPFDGILDDYEKALHKTRVAMNLASRRMRIKNNIPKSSMKKKENKQVSYKKLKDFIYGYLDIRSRILGYNFLAKHLDRKVRKHKVADCNYVSRYKYHDEVFKKSFFEEQGIYEFEGHKFKSVKNYDEFLKQLYGDYMKELPKEMQRSHHQFKVTWRE